MATFAPSSGVVSSPKRKRDAESSGSRPQPPSALPRPATDTEIDLSGAPTDTGSPRSVVANHLEQLEIADPWIQQLSYQEPGRQRKRFAHMSPEPTARTSQVVNGQLEQHPSSSLVHGSSPLLNEPVTISQQTENTDIAASTILSRPSTRSASPPLDGDPEDNPLTWHESEITGHNPTDPTDDGYGINGIGFRPTPAMAWARSQKRKQQIADYRSREAKEARQRRSERRRHLSGEMSNGFDAHGKQYKVRFAESDL